MKVLSILAIIFCFSQCGTTKLETNPPFKISSATYSTWVGGQPGVRGVKVEISLVENTTVPFDSLYFKRMKTKLEKREINGKQVLLGHFNTSKNQDIVFHIDPKEEIKNEPPTIITLPFELKEDEAILSYTINNKIQYYKITSVKKTK